MADEIRYLTVESLDEAYEIEAECFRTPWEYADLSRDMASNPCARYMGVFRDGRLIAYGCVWLIMEEAHVMNVAVRRAHRRTGAGEALMRALIQASADGGARYMELECRAGNEPAKRLYHKLGFLRVGCRKGYYTDTGEDAHVYAKIDMPASCPENDPFLRAETDG